MTWKPEDPLLLLLAGFNIAASLPPPYDFVTVLNVGAAVACLYALSK